MISFGSKYIYFGEEEYEDVPGSCFRLSLSASLHDFPKIFFTDLQKKLEEGIGKIAQQSENIQKRFTDGETCLIDLLDTVATHKLPQNRQFFDEFDLSIDFYYSLGRSRRIFCIER
jgi:hypothetical protein